jgi:hypothetical protein
MGKLHELLAVEADKANVFKAVVDEAKVTFTKRSEHFFGFQKRLEYFDEEENAKSGTVDIKEIDTTVYDKLDWVGQQFSGYIDVVLQKEKTNQEAVADLEIDGVVIAKDLPATFLLGLEEKMKRIKDMILTVGTLPPGIKWEKDPSKGEHIYKRVEPETTFKTEKTFMHKVLYDATKEHPAQIEKWNVNTNVGKYITDSWSGLISPAKKAELLERVDKLIQATKKARMRANCTEVKPASIGNAICRFISGEKKEGK